jgi:hypothetical protein
VSTPETGSLQLRLKQPDTDDDSAWVVDQSDTYTAAVSYVSYFIEQRARMGDMSSAEVLKEFDENVCRFMRGGYDVHGEQ